MRQKEEARWSLRNYHRAPTKGEIILANHTVLCAAVVVAFAFALPHIIGQLFEVLLYV